MKLKQWAAVIFCAVAATMAPATPAAAQYASDVTIRVCNNSGRQANVAISYQPVGSGRFYNEGWFGVAPGDCADIAHTDNAYFYGYAEVVNDGSTYWAGNHSLCVVYPGPYRFWSDNTEYCSGNQTLREFVVLHATDFGVFTWTLDP